MYWCKSSVAKNSSWRLVVDRSAPDDVMLAEGAAVTCLGELRGNYSITRVKKGKMKGVAYNFPPKLRSNCHWRFIAKS